MINEKAQQLLDELCKIDSMGVMASMETALDECIESHKMESPIEQIFYVAWLYSCRYLNDIQLCPQKKIGNFRVDFEVDIFGHFVNHEYPFTCEQLEEISKNCTKIAIELDGHDWHEKTKEQVEKDKKRERFIVSSGYRIFRFSGREVFKDPLSCVDEVRNFIRPIIRDIKLKYWVRNG